MIEFQYFEGCPNSQATLANLRALIAEGWIAEEELVITEVPDPERAQELNFQGSPTVLYHGIDIYTEKVPESSNFSCRIYEIDGRQTGELSEDYLKQQLRMLRG
jgi:hypothetical protein